MKGLSLTSSLIRLSPPSPSRHPWLHLPTTTTSTTSGPSLDTRPSSVEYRTGTSVLRSLALYHGWTLTSHRTSLRSKINQSTRSWNSSFLSLYRELTSFPLSFFIVPRNNFPTVLTLTILLLRLYFDLWVCSSSGPFSPLPISPPEEGTSGRLLPATRSNSW